MDEVRSFVVDFKVGPERVHGGPCLVGVSEPARPSLGVRLLLGLFEGGILGVRFGLIEEDVAIVLEFFLVQLQVFVPSVCHRLVLQAIVVRVDLPVDVLTANADFVLIEEGILAVGYAFFDVVKVDLDEEDEYDGCGGEIDGDERIRQVEEDRKGEVDKQLSYEEHGGVDDGLVADLELDEDEEHVHGYCHCEDVDGV